MLDLKQISNFIRNQGLTDSVLCLHSSYKSFGPCENGPDTVIEGLSSNGTTLLCPSFYYRGGTYPPESEKNKWINNGIDYSSFELTNPQSYEDSPDQIDPSMGIIPKLLLHKAGALRSRSPENSFVALGPLAKDLCDSQTNIDVYAPYKMLYKSNIKAFIVLAGIDFSSCTPIHFAEEAAGKGLFHRWVLHHGETVEVCIGSCSDGFEKIAPFTQDIERRFTLGESTIRIYEFSTFIERVATLLAEKPDLSHCEDPGCLRCRDMAAGGCRAAVL